MNGNSPSIRKPQGGSPWVIVALVLAALFAGGSGSWPLAVLLVVALVGYLVVRPSGPATAVPDLSQRVEFLERRVKELQDAVEALRRARPAAPARERAAAPPPRPAAPPPPPPPRPPKPAAAPAPRVEAPAASSFDWARTISTADLMGAKALAFAGGIVTLLGVVFFFVLAVNRGWVGPELRIACGGVASAIVFAAGFWLQGRYETTYSALAAVGAGIAGAYASLLAAVSLYDMVSKPVALVVAGAIASVGVAVSLAWSEEIVAGFGLIGAMVVPATLVFQGGLQEIGTAFVAVVFAGGAVVAVRERWWKMLQVAALVGLAQVFTGSSLTYAWAAEAALLAWLSSRVRDTRFQLAALVYLGLALVHAIALEASPDH